MLSDNRAQSSKVMWIMIVVVIALVIGFISLSISKRSGQAATGSLETTGGCGFVSGKGYCSTTPIAGENCQPHTSCPKEKQANVDAEIVYMKQQAAAFEDEKKRMKEQGIQWSDLTAQQKNAKTAMFFGYCCEPE